MREVEVSRLTDVIEKLCIEANEHLPEDVKCAIKTCRACEDGEIAKGILDNIIENFDIADNENVPIFSDCIMWLIRNWSSWGCFPAMKRIKRSITLIS